MEGDRNTNVFKRDLLSVKRREKGAVRMFVSIVLFTVLALAFCYFRFSLPFLPKFISIEFSVFAELLAAISYGPIVAVVICLLKGAIFTVLVPGGAISNIANFFVEGAFVVTVGIYYYRIVFGKSRHKKGERSHDKNHEKSKEKKNIHRRKAIIKSSFVGMIPALIIQFIATNNYVFPTLHRYYRNYGYSYDDILLAYVESTKYLAAHLPKGLSPLVPNITEIWQGILVFNIPLTFLKLVIVTLIIALIYPIISPYLHFRKKAK